MFVVVDVVDVVECVCVAAVVVAASAAAAVVDVAAAAAAVVVVVAASAVIVVVVVVVVAAAAAVVAWCLFVAAVVEKLQPFHLPVTTWVLLLGELSTMMLLSIVVFETNHVVWAMQPVTVIGSFGNLTTMMLLLIVVSEVYFGSMMKMLDWFPVRCNPYAKQEPCEFSAQNP